MNGTILNACAILGFGLLALLTRKQLAAKVQVWVKLVLGAGLVVCGLRLVWVSVSGPLPLFCKQMAIVLAALILGRLTGRALRLQKLSNRLGHYARVRLEQAGREAPGRSGEGFKVCAALFCAAPLAVLGSLQDGLSGYTYPLVIKASMDGLATMSFVSTFGLGAVGAAVPVLAWQGTIALLAHAAAPWLEQQGLLNSVNATGGFLVSFVSLLIFEVVKLEIANYLPALLWAPLLTWLWR